MENKIISEETQLITLKSLKTFELKIVYSRVEAIPAHFGAIQLIGFERELFTLDFLYFRNAIEAVMTDEGIFDGAKIRESIKKDLLVGASLGAFEHTMAYYHKQMHKQLTEADNLVSGIADLELDDKELDAMFNVGQKRMGGLGGFSILCKKNDNL